MGRIDTETKAFMSDPSRFADAFNYLIYDPDYGKTSKLVKAMEQIDKGKDIKIITIDDFKKALNKENA